MEKKEINEILKRIKSNYQDFVVDEYKINEWNRELKNYDFNDVMNKLEQHLRSEEYGKFPPKLYFLTKYLQTTEEKNTKTNFKLQCSICGEYVDENIYVNHYERCLDIDYIKHIRKKYFDTDITVDTIQKLKALSENQFYNKYLEFLNNIYDQVPNEEQELINRIINPPKTKKFDIGE